VVSGFFTHQIKGAPKNTEANRIVDQYMPEGGINTMD